MTVWRIFDFFQPRAKTIIFVKEFRHANISVYFRRWVAFFHDQIVIASSPNIVSVSERNLVRGCAFFMHCSLSFFWKLLRNSMTHLFSHPRLYIAQ